MTHEGEDFSKEPSTLVGGVVTQRTTAGGAPHPRVTDTTTKDVIQHTET